VGVPGDARTGVAGAHPQIAQHVLSAPYLAQG
jgi:hypothetical protein